MYRLVDEHFLAIVDHNNQVMLGPYPISKGARQVLEDLIRTWNNIDNKLSEEFNVMFSQHSVNPKL